MSKRVFLAGLWAAAILAAVGFCANLAMAQQRPATETPEAAAEQAREKARDERKKALDEARKKAVEREREQAEKAKETRVVIYSLVYADAQTMVNKLNSLDVQREGVRVAGDARTNSILAIGPEESLQVVEAIVKRLDVERPDRPVEAAQWPSKPTGVHLRVIWLADGPPESDATGVGTAPVDDKAVLAELAVMGFKNVRQVGQAMVSTLSGGQFHLGYTPLWKGKPVRLDVTGNLNSGPSPNTFSLGVVLHSEKKESVAVPLPQPGMMPQEPGVMAEGVNLELSTIIRSLKYTVLGVAPAGEITSIFVVQIIPLE